MLKAELKRNKRSPVDKRPVVVHNSLFRSKWTCPDCSYAADLKRYRYQRETKYTKSQLTVGVECTGTYLARSHVRSRRREERYGCLFCTLEDPLTGQPGKLMTTFLGRTALMQHIRDHHVKPPPSPRVLQIVNGAVGETAAGNDPSDVRIWKRPV